MNVAGWILVVIISGYSHDIHFDTQSNCLIAKENLLKAVDNQYPVTAFCTPG